MEISIKINNLPQIMSALRKSPYLMARNLNKAITYSIAKVQQKSVPLTPVKTGRLRASYHTYFRNLYGMISPETDYAIYVHEGTRFMRARPFLAEGISESNKDIQNYFEKAVEDTLNQIANETK